MVQQKARVCSNQAVEDTHTHTHAKHMTVEGGMKNGMRNGMKNEGGIDQCILARARTEGRRGGGVHPSDRSMSTLLLGGKDGAAGTGAGGEQLASTDSLEDGRVRLLLGLLLLGSLLL